MASMSLRHVDLTQRTVFQDARHVRTKNRKTFTSNFFPVGADIEAIVTDLDFVSDAARSSTDRMIRCFRRRMLWSGKAGILSRRAEARALERGGDAIRWIFRRAFEAAGLPYANPHLCRDTLTLLGEKRCKTPEELKAWSQNLGHDHVLTTLTSYGAVSSARQSEILNSMRSCGAEVGTEPDPETVRQVVAHFKKGVLNRIDIAKEQSV